MKKLFILIAFLTIPAVAISQMPLSQGLRPVSHSNIKAEPMALLQSGTALENLFLTSPKGDMFLAEGEEVYTDRMAEGQMYEMGPGASYYLTYDPISQYVFGISCGRFLVFDENDNPTDSVQKVGVLRYGKYVKGERLGWKAQFVYDTTDLDPSRTGLPPTKNLNNWNMPTVVVANPEGSTDISKLKLAFSMKMDRMPRSGTAYQPSFTTVSLMNCDNLLLDQLDPNFVNAVSSTDLDMPTLYPKANYPLNHPLKGHVAYFDGIPYSFFFGPVFNDLDRASNPYSFYIMSTSLNNIPTIGESALDDQIQVNQFLSPEIESIFGANLTVVGEDNGQMLRGFNLDSDTTGNLYVAILETPQKNSSNINNSGRFQSMRVPTVVKAKYNTDRTVSDDLFKPGEYIAETMPFSALKNYIVDENGGLFDTTQDATAPSFTHYRYEGNNTLNWNEIDLPFLVTGEDTSHFLLPLYWIAEGLNEETGETERYFTTDLVEVLKEGNQWRIKQVAPNIEGWFLNTARYPSNQWVPSIGLFFQDTLGGDTILRMWNGSAYYNRMYSNIDIQISITADKNYLIAKWNYADTTDKVKLSSSIDFVEGAATEHTITDTMFAPSLYLSYRHVHPDSSWSTPVRASNLNRPENAADFDPVRDTISFLGTYMPRIVPSVDEVIVSYSYGYDQDPWLQEHLADKIVRHRSVSYRYTGIIVPSARTGPNYLGIEEGEPATVDHLAPAYPNPTNNTVNFSFSLLKPAYTRLTISNALGQEVAVVVDQFCNASEYNWNDYSVANLPVGVYYFTLTSGDVRQTKIFTIAR